MSRVVRFLSVAVTGVALLAAASYWLAGPRPRSGNEAIHMATAAFDKAGIDVSEPVVTGLGSKLPNSSSTSNASTWVIDLMADGEPVSVEIFKDPRYTKVAFLSDNRPSPPGGRVLTKGEFDSLASHSDTSELNGFRWLGVPVSLAAALIAGLGVGLFGATSREEKEEILHNE